MYSPFAQQPMMPNPPAWANGYPYPGQYYQPQPQLPAGFSIPRELIQNFVITAWNAGQSKDDILDEAINVGHTRQEIAFISNLLDDLEASYQPTEDEIKAYVRKVKATFKKSKSSKALQTLADNTPNRVLKGLAQKAADALKEAEQSGKSGSSFKMVDLRELVLKQQVSVLIGGNSGSGKSSVTNLICSDFSHSPHLTHGRLPQILILDSHFNDWGVLPVVHRKPDILRSLHIACLELQRRQEHWAWQIAHLPPAERRKDCWFFFILVWDEIGSTIAYADSEEGRDLIRAEGLIHPSVALRLLGSEYRKFQGLVIGLNQSVNCDALGIDSAYRSNFLDIHLCEMALAKAKEYGWGIDSPEYIYLSTQAYACLVRRQIALHPTHYFYSTFANNNPPANFPPARTEPLSLMLPRRPLSFQQNDNLYAGEILPMREIQRRYEQMIAAYQQQEDDEPVSEPTTRFTPEVPTISPPSTITNTPTNPVLDDLWADETESEQILRQAYNDIRRCRSLPQPMNKTAICATWEGRTETKLKRYDDALARFGIEWVREFVQDGQLTVRFQDILETIWDVTPNKRSRARYQNCRSALGRILTALGVELPWQEETSNNRVVPLRRDE